MKETFLLLLAAALATETAFGANPLDRLGEFGLWRITFADGHAVSAGDFAADSATVTATASGERRKWTSGAVDVEVAIRRSDARTTDLQARVTVRQGTAVELALPARLRFGADEVRRFVYPGVCLFGPGMAFNAKFYREKLNIDIKYPTLGADFAQLETTRGERLAVYGIRRRPTHAPWENPAPFVPGRTATGGDATGGWFDHAFVLYAHDGATWQSPVVRLRTEAPLDTALADYASANGLTRTLAQKVRDPALLDKLLHAPLYNINDLTGTTLPAARAALDAWPKPTLFHFTGYLRGGFDKQYPDHLPPNAAFGTMADLKALVAYAHARGHVVCPYTNPTWWCDNPRGPTFAAAGEAPLARKADGSSYHEQYADCDGYVQTYAHPASREANARTVRQFSADCPVDLLFQDQCGSRDWIWNFNEALASPTLQTEGLIAMGEEDSASVPLATEDGWDGIANSETAFMGCTRRIVPYENRPMELYKEIYPPDTWEIEPVLLRLLHGKVLFYQHNLGQFTDDARILAWTLALGYSVSFCSAAYDCTADEACRTWYEFLHLLQNKVIARLAGKPMTAFRHDRAPLFATAGDPTRTADDGVVTARFADVATAVNLGDVPRTVAGHRLAAYGWDIAAPGLHAHFLEGGVPTVEADGCRWTYATRKIESVPTRAEGTRARLGVIGIAGLSPWGGAGMPDEWSATLAKAGFAVETIASAAALKDALAHPGDWLGIVNPYGEALPEEREGDWTNVVDAVAAYVRTGGDWFETGGVSFVAGVRPGTEGPVHEFIGGLARLGLCVGSFPSTTADLAPLVVTETGTNILSAASCARFPTEPVRVNRPLPLSTRHPLEVLVRDTAGRPFLGAYRLEGGGALWRFGMTVPPQAVAFAAVADILRHRRQHGADPVPPIALPQIFTTTDSVSVPTNYVSPLTLECKKWK